MSVTNVTELNDLVARVKKAQREFANFSQEQVAMMKDYEEDLPILEFVIHQRKAFGYAAGEGRTVDELKGKIRDKVAIEELKQLMKKLFSN